MKINKIFYSLLVLALLFQSLPCFSQQVKLVLPIGHDEPVNAATFSPDNKTIVTVANKSAKMWDVGTGKLLYTFGGLSSYALPARYSPDGKTVLISSFGEAAQLFDVKTGSLVFKIGDNKHPGGNIKFSPDGKYIISDDMEGATIYGGKVSDAKNGQLKMKIEDATAEYSPDSKLIGINMHDSSIAFINAVNGNTFFKISKEKNIFFRDYFFSSNKYVAVTGTSTRIYDFQIPKLILEIPVTNVKKVVFSPDGKTFSLIYKSDEIQIWNLAAKKIIQKLQPSSSEIYDIIYSPDSKELLASSVDSFARVIAINSGSPTTSIYIGERNETPIQFSADGSKLLSYDSRDDGGPHTVIAYADLWSTHPFAIQKKLVEIPSSMQGLHFSNDGRKIVSFHQNGDAIIWDVSTGKILNTLTSHITTINKVAFSQTGDSIFSYSQSNGISYRDNQTRKLRGADKNINPGSNVSGLFKLNGGLVYISYMDSTMDIWSIETNSILKTLHTPFIINFVKISSNGDALIASDLNVNAAIWETNHFHQVHDVLLPFALSDIMFSGNGSLIFVPACISDSTNFMSLYDPAHKKYVGKYTFIKNALTNPFAVYDSLGNIVEQNAIAKSFTSSVNKFFFQNDLNQGKLYDIESGTELFTLTDVQKISYATFNEDGKKLLTSGNGITKIWDVTKGTLLAKLDGNNFIKHASFSFDNNFLLTVSADNEVKKWKLPDAELLYSFFELDSSNQLIIDRYGRFDGTRFARELLYFTCGNEIIELDQLKDQLWTPGLAEKLIEGKNINSKKLVDLNICGLTPEVETLKDNGYQYQYKITPRRGGLGETVLYVNGIEAKRFNQSQLKKNGNDFELIVNKEDLKNYFTNGEENSITVKAYTADNSISSRGIIVKEDKTKQSTAAPNLYAVMVGVSDYKGDELDLKYAAKDATDLSSAISNAAKKLLNAVDGKEHVFMYNLTTSKESNLSPEKNSIKQALEEIGKKTTANDILLIFFAGHGVMKTENKQFYFLTADASTASAIDATADVGISTNELSEWIKPQNIKAQKRILIFDACNSGQAIKDLVSIGKADQNYVAARSDDKSQQIKAIDKLNERSGLFILSASSSDQSAYEMSRYSQGLLTYSLLKAIKQQPDILEDGKYLNVGRWFSAAEKTVSDIAKESGHRQEPQVVTASNINVGIVDDDVIAKIILPQEKPMFTASNFQNSDENIADDNLELGKAINKQFYIASRGKQSSMEYIESTNLPGSYLLTGRYELKGNDLFVKVNIKKDKDIKLRFDITGKKDSIEQLASEIIDKVEAYIKTVTK